VVIDDFEGIYVPVTPSEADPVLLIDAYAVLPTAITRKLLESIARGLPQVFDSSSGFEDQELSIGRTLNSDRQTRTSLSFEDLLRCPAIERLNHTKIITRGGIIVTRYYQISESNAFSNRTLYELIQLHLFLGKSLFPAVPITAVLPVEFQRSNATLVVER